LILISWRLALSVTAAGQKLPRVADEHVWLAKTSRAISPLTITFFVGVVINKE